MKTKLKKGLLTLLMSAPVTAVWAQQPTDVTSKYIANPSFEVNGTNGWVAASLATQTNTSFTKKHGNTYLEKWVSSGSAGNASVLQTIENLAPGKYTLTVAAQNQNQSDKTKECTGVTIFAGSASTKVTFPDDYTVDFTHLSGDITIGYKAENASGNYICVDNFRLTYNGAPAAAELKPALTTLIEKATKLYGDGTGVNAAALKSLIDAAQAAVDNAEATDDAVLEAYNNLNEGMTSYTYDNASEENPYDLTKQLIVNPSFEQSGTANWTNVNFKSQSNTSFTKKSGTTYIEKWTDKGKAVGDAKISQVIKNLKNDKYKLVVAAQNLDQNSTSKKCLGAYIYAGTNETPVYTPNDYSVTFTSIAGEIEIGYRAEGATGNWLAADNFRIYLVGHLTPADVVAEIQNTITTAKTIQSGMMSAKAAKALEDAIAQGNAITETSDEATVKAAKKALDAAIVNAMASAQEYLALQNVIDKAEKSYDATKKEAAAFRAAIDEAIALHANAEATSQQLADAIPALERAILAFNLANSTTGTTIKVTATNHYVPTGATEFLMRATMTGTAIEKGVCWSTEHNPTVLDSRSTKSHTLNGTIFHGQGLTPSTVYYVRPYIMNSTYNVVYGDEVKIVTRPKGTSRGTWNEGAPTEEANARCRNAIKETIDYYNEWTGVSGFTLSGNYGAGTPTADCSYGGWMRIGPNAGNQAIGTVLHETCHGVGVGTSARWKDTNVHNWKWYGRAANEAYGFLENKEANPYTSDFCVVGDSQHGWGSSATYDWFVNGADKDKHLELQYIGGCHMLYGMFIDGLNPTSAQTNGIKGYTYNFDDDKRYYLMCKSDKCGLGTGLVYQRGTSNISWRPMNELDVVSDSAAWYLEYEPKTCTYRIKNALSGKYMSHASTLTLKTTSKPSTSEDFQFMPDRTDVTLKDDKGKSFKTHGYWFTWNSSGDKSVQAGTMGKTYGSVTAVAFNYADTATNQQWILISEDELPKYGFTPLSTDIQDIPSDDAAKTGATDNTIYDLSGRPLNGIPSQGLYIQNGNKYMAK